MNKHKCFLGLAILATLVTTPAQAESVYGKAADLMVQNSNLTRSKLSASKLNYWYVSGSTGLAFPRDVNVNLSNSYVLDLDLNSGFQLTGGGGYQQKNTRAEVEVSFRSPGVGTTGLSGNINQTTFLVNGYYDIPTKSKLHPYVGVGIGFGLISPNVKSGGSKVETSNGKSFAYQGKIGVEYEVVKKGNAFVELKYVGLTGYTSKKNETEIELGSFNAPALSIGYRQGF